MSTLEGGGVGSLVFPSPPQYRDLTHLSSSPSLMSPLVELAPPSSEESPKISNLLDVGVGGEVWVGVGIRIPPTPPILDLGLGVCCRVCGPLPPCGVSLNLWDPGPGVVPLPPRGEYLGPLCGWGVSGCTLGLSPCVGPRFPWVCPLDGPVWILGGPCDGPRPPEVWGVVVVSSGVPFPLSLGCDPRLMGSPGQLGPPIGGSVRVSGRTAAGLSQLWQQKVCFFTLIL